MRDHVERHWGFFKTTAVGGLVFLLPLIVVGTLLAKAVQVIAAAVTFLIEQEFVQEYLHAYTPTVHALLFLGALAGLIAICFLCGVLAHRRMGRWFTDKAERYLLMLFPRYAVFKDQLTGNLGGGDSREKLKPVIVRYQDADRIGMEVERNHDSVTVYLPTAPDPWTGQVVVLSSANVRPFRGDVGEVMATFEQLGRGTQRYLWMNPPNKLVTEPATDTLPGEN